MSTINILQDIINHATGTLHVGKIEKKKPTAPGVKTRCGILIDKSFVVKNEVNADSDVYLTGKEILQASLDCKSICGTTLIVGHSEGNALSPLGMVLCPEGTVKIRMDVAAEYIDRIKAA